MELGELLHVDDTASAVEVVEAFLRDAGATSATVTAGDPPTVDADVDAALLAAVRAALGATLARLDAEAAAAMARRRLADSERVGEMGSFDWDIARDRNDWSDELFRIYGYAPGAIDPDYETFISLLHPDERDRVRALHAEAYQHASAFEMEERILRPDGEERVLWSQGEVVTDDAGTPVRMIGVCRDVTEQRATEAARDALTADFRALVEAAPDAILLVGADGRVEMCNARAGALFRAQTDDLLARPVGDLLPDGAAPTGGRPRTDVTANAVDGTTMEVDVVVAPIGAADGRRAVFVRDAAPRRAAEADRRRVADADQRRRQALELNDTVVQGLVALLWRLEGDLSARALAQATLDAAKRIMSDLLTGIGPGGTDLVRSVPAGETAQPVAPGEAAPPAPPTERDAPPTTRVLVADDAAEIRSLLRLYLARVSGLEVVAEARHGEEALDLVARHTPDVVVLDVSMPVCDGLEAATRLRERGDDVCIVVFSGYPEAAMRDRALAAGADAYVEKTADLGRLADEIAALAGRRSGT